MPERVDETWFRLSRWTAGSTVSERLAAQVLLASGYSRLDPIHPRGGPDGTADAIAQRNGQRWIMGVYFPNDPVSFSEVRRKFGHDLVGVSQNEAVGIAFVTNQELSKGERRQLEQMAEHQVDLFHLERIVALLDSPPMHPVRRQFLAIDVQAVSSSPTSVQSLAMWHDAEERAAKHRRLSRLRGGGVPPSRLSQVEAWLSAHPETLELPRVPQGALTVIAAPAGSGKTECAHEWYLRNLGIALSSTQGPLCMWLTASPSLTNLIMLVERHFGTEAILNAGVALALDGLEVLPTRDAIQLLEAAEELCAKWPGVSVLATGRTDFNLARFATLPAPEWEPWQGRELAEVVAGAEIPQQLVSHELAKAMSSPRVAIGLGSMVFTGTQLPRDRASLVAAVSDQALRAAQVPLTSDLQALLAQVACHVVSSGRSFPIAEISGEELAALIRTPIITRESDALSFALSIHEQTHAGRAIQSGKIQLADAVAVPSFARWRYSVAQALVAAQPQTAESMFASIVRVNPAAASWLLGEVLPGVVPEEEDAKRREIPPFLLESLSIDPLLDEDVRAAVVPIAAAHRAWVESLGPLGRLLSDRAGTDKSWAVGESSGQTIVAYPAFTERYDVYALPDPEQSGDFFARDGGRRWRRLHAFRSRRTWSRQWEWGRDQLRHELEKCIRSFALTTSPLQDLDREWLWQLLITHLPQRERPRRGQGLSQETVLALVEQKLRREEESPGIHWVSGGLHATKSDWQRLGVLASHSNTLLPPLLPPDLPTGRWIWSGHSSEQLRDATALILEAAIDGYADLLEMNFPSFGAGLALGSLGRLAVVGQISYPDVEELQSDSYHPGPSLDYFIVPAGEEAKPVNLTLATGDAERYAFIDDALGSGEKHRTRKLRHASALTLFSTRPRTLFAYEWLVSDLKEVGWCGNVVLTGD